MVNIGAIWYTVRDRDKKKEKYIFNSIKILECTKYDKTMVVLQF